jgi:hypothetical protein
LQTSRLFEILATVSDWNKINPRGFYGEASMRTLETGTLRAITRHTAGEPQEVIDRAVDILSERHATPTRIKDSVLSPYERTLQRKTDTSQV